MKISGNWEENQKRRDDVRRFRNEVSEIVDDVVGRRPTVDSVVTQLTSVSATEEDARKSLMETLMGVIGTTVVDEDRFTITMREEHNYSPTYIPVDELDDEIKKDVVNKISVYERAWPIVARLRLITDEPWKLILMLFCDNDKQMAIDGIMRFDITSKAIENIKAARSRVAAEEDLDGEW